MTVKKFMEKYEHKVCLLNGIKYEILSSFKNYEGLILLATPNEYEVYKSFIDGKQHFDLYNTPHTLEYKIKEIVKNTLYSISVFVDDELVDYFELITKE